MITVKSLLLAYFDRLGFLEVIENGGIKNGINSQRVQKTALGITGLTTYLHSGRVQIFGNSEIAYLKQLKEEEQLKNLEKIFSDVVVPAVVITNAIKIPYPLKKISYKFKIPIFRSALHTEHFIDQVTEILYEQFAIGTNMHGTLIDVNGIGLLLVGKSGIGKSETALELIKRGHRFISDDVVKIKKLGPNLVHGYAPNVIKHYLEIRGLGVINIKDLFGVVSIRNRKKVELVIELSDWNPQENYDRIGLEQQYYQILEVKIPYLKLPLRQGRDIATIVEMAARNEIAKLQGFHGARNFHQRMMVQISGVDDNEYKD